MKYRVEAAGRAFEVKAISQGRGQGPPGAERVEVDGEELVLDVVPGHVLHQGRSLRYQVRRDARGVPQAIILDGHEIPVTVEDARRAAANRSSRAASGEVTAPMNGQVVKILRQEGDAVEKGDVVLVLEAMKMENEVGAPISGRVQALRVAQGANVKPGDALFRIEAAAEQ